MKTETDVNLVIEAHRLTKSYGSEVLAVDDFELSVRRGEIYGLLGPNGAGKTTILKMLLGLVKPTSGYARVLGDEPGSEGSLSQVGALVEEPTFYPYLSGRNNLKALAYYSGKKVSKGRIQDVLNQVGLKTRANNKFKEYSTGMRQRLGLAAALLEDPELLILDEPTNGLDPKGVAEIRNFIDSLKSKRTVLLSSHLLSEVEQLSDRVGIIQRGKLVTQGALDQLTGETYLLVKATPLDKAVQVAAELEEVEETRISDGMLQLSIDPLHSPVVNRKLVYAGIDVFESKLVRQSLEDVFLSLTEEGGT